MAAKRAKNNVNDDTKEDEDQKDTMLENRLSDLPDAIITHILSLLPTILAIRMSLLSRRWRRMWTLVHALDFCDTREMGYFRSNFRSTHERQKFFKFMNCCLKHPYTDTTITKFKLCMDFYGAGQKVDGWLRFLVKKNVKELDLSVVAQRYVQYSLPDFVLGLRTLTLLKLKGVELKTLSPLSLPFLEALHLVQLQLTDQVLSNVLSDCPSLERLLISNCSGLMVPKFQSSNLKYMEFINCNCIGIKIEATSLVSFVYFGDHYDSKECLIFLTPCATLRNLSLSSARLTDGWLFCFVPLFPQLESLSLTSCFGLKEIKLCNENLKELVIERDSHRRSDSFEPVLLIYAPNLVSFTFTGYSVMKLSWLAPKILSAKIRIYSHFDEKTTYSVEWYTNLIQFLSNLNYCKNVKIFCSNEKALIIPNELQAIHRCPLPDLENLKVETGPPLYRKAMFRKSLQWLWPNYSLHSS